MQAPSNTPQSPHRHPLSLSATLQASYRTLGSLQVRDDYPNARLPSSGVSWARASISNPHACYEPIWVGGSSCLEHSTRCSGFPLPTWGPSWTAAASVHQDNPLPAPDDQGSGPTVTPFAQIAIPPTTWFPSSSAVLPGLLASSISSIFTVKK